MSRSLFLTATLFILGFSTSAYAEEDISLFNNNGKATAYISFDDELTIYLWNGKPVAYLKSSNAGEFHVYGFNGKHLGWFSKEAIWDHDGFASCATKKVMQSTEPEPYKSYKEYKPYRAYGEYAPYMPYLSNSFSELSCKFLLMSGAE